MIYFFKNISFVVKYLSFLTLGIFLFDSVDYIANAVFVCPRWTNQRRKKNYMQKHAYLFFCIK